MRLLITTDTVGGVWTYTRELASGLVRRGHEVALVSFGHAPSARQTVWMKGLPRLEFFPTTFRLEWMQEAEADIEASTDFLYSLIDDVKPELLHLNQYCYGSMRSDLPRLVVAHSDVVSWSVAVHGCEPADSGFTRWYRQVVADGLAAADQVVAPSRWMLQNVARYFVQPRHSAVIYNGRSPHLFRTDHEKEKVVLSVGRLWDGGKQTSLLLDAGAEIPVWIAGDDKHPEHNGAHWEMGSKARFWGRLDESEMSGLFARAAIYAATSRYEPFGLAPVEAALSGCAVIANDIGPFRELWGENVLYFCRDDASDLRSILAQLSAGDNLRREYACRARDHATARFNANRMVDEYIALYEQLIAREATVTNRAGAA